MSGARRSRSAPRSPSSRASSIRKRFVRVHKSHVVNIARVAEVTPWVSGDWRIRLQDGAEVNLSRRYRQRFEALVPVRRAVANDVPQRLPVVPPGSPVVTKRSQFKVFEDRGRGVRNPLPEVSSCTTRRADLDWLRVLAFSLLILYHAGMAWSGWSWHVTSPDSTEWLREAMRFLNRWRMPLLFLVSGAAIMLALGDRSSGGFVVDRAERLLLPLGFGMAGDRAAAGLPRAPLSRPVHGLVLRLAAAGFLGRHLPERQLQLAPSLVPVLRAGADTGAAAGLPVGTLADGARHASSGPAGRPPLRSAVADGVAACRVEPVAGAGLAQHQRPGRRLERSGLLRRAACSTAPSSSVRPTC